MKLFVKKKLSSQKVPSKMFHWLLSRPRLLNTSLVHIDTTEPNNVHAHSLARLSFFQKEEIWQIVNDLN